MHIHTIEGDDDINKAFTSVMENTLYTLYSETKVLISRVPSDSDE